MRNEGISRRGFLKKAGLVGLALSVVGCVSDGSLMQGLGRVMAGTSDDWGGYFAGSVIEAEGVKMNQQEVNGQGSKQEVNRYVKIINLDTNEIEKEMRCYDKCGDDVYNYTENKINSGKYPEKGYKFEIIHDFKMAYKGIYKVNRERKLILSDFKVIK